MLLMTAEMRPSFHKSPIASPRAELTAVIAGPVLAVHFGINVAVDEQEIGPAVIVHIGEHHAPAKILGVQAESRGKSLVVKRAIAVVAVKSRGIVGKICFE